MKVDQKHTTQLLKDTKSKVSGISVICGVMNRSQTLARSLKNWLSFGQIDEIVIVDWGSSDGLSTIINGMDDPRLRIVRVESVDRWVLTFALNLAASFATRDKLLKLDSDVTLHPSFFANHNLCKGGFFAGDWRLAKSRNEQHLNGAVFCYRADFVAINGYDERIQTYGWDDDNLYERLEINGLHREAFRCGSLVHEAHSDFLRVQNQTIASPSSHIQKNKVLARNSTHWSFFNRQQQYQVLPTGDKRQMTAVRLEKRPRVSIITSSYRGDLYIESFMENIVQQTIFKDCELILINPASPGSEFTVIEKYLKKYRNIRYVELDKDPGLYEVWNMGIRMAKSEYVTNANLDDGRSPLHLEKHSQVLDDCWHIDAVCAPLKVTRKINQKWESVEPEAVWFRSFNGDFRGQDLFERLNNRSVKSRNFMHCMPVWRKSLHRKFGYFDEDTYGPSADWEFWLRCSSLGGVVYRMLEEPLGIYLLDPNSHNRRFPKKELCEQKIIRKYFKR